MTGTDAKTVTRTILAIDPGNEMSAWVLYHADGKRPIAHGYESNMDLLKRLTGWYIDPAPTLAVEMIASYGMSVGKSVFETCVWIGRFVQAWPTAASLVYRMQVKMHLCHNTRAKDSNIRQALIDLFGDALRVKPGGKKYILAGDEWAALAVAVTFAETIAPQPEAR